MYDLEFSDYFVKKYRKLAKGNERLQSKVESTLLTLRKNPQDKKLRSHKVATRSLGEKWSSRVTGDIRVIWDYGEEGNMVILLLDIGGHSGSKKVYN